MAIAEVTLTCAKCGMVFMHRKKCYNRTDADQHEHWAKNAITECPACYRARMAAEKAAHLAEFVSKVENRARKKLVTLVGTEKQVNWANNIRAEFIEETLRGFSESNIKYDSLVDFVSREPNASWWIDHRKDSRSFIDKKLNEKTNK